jgi:hypothetical protein
MNEWELNVSAACLNARTHPRAKGAGPHWLRCLHTRDDVRCVLPEGHVGDHQEPKGEEQK